MGDGGVARARRESSPRESGRLAIGAGTVLDVLTLAVLVPHDDEESSSDSRAFIAAFTEEPTPFSTDPAVARSAAPRGWPSVGIDGRPNKFGAGRVSMGSLEHNDSGAGLLEHDVSEALSVVSIGSVGGNAKRLADGAKS